jgi:hypothetical protein
MRIVDSSTRRRRVRQTALGLFDNGVTKDASGLGPFLARGRRWCGVDTVNGLLDKRVQTSAKEKDEYTSFIHFIPTQMAKHKSYHAFSQQRETSCTSLCGFQRLERVVTDQIGRGKEHSGKMAINSNACFLSIKLYHSFNQDECV